jgi:hypothetical protein
MNVRKIVTHAGFAHVDEFLATVALLVKFPEAEVHRVPSVSEPPEGTVVVDVGGRYDNETFFDHHHDPNLPASIVLVLKKFYPEVDLGIDEIQWISDWDSLGPTKTQEKWGVKLPPFRDPITDIVLKVFESKNVITPRDPFHAVLIEIGRKFIETITRASENIRKVKEIAEVSEIKGLKIVRVPEIIPIQYIKKVHPDVAVVIQPNPRTLGAVSIVRVDDHPRVDFNRIRGKVPAHFIHANGFMAVIDPAYISQALDAAIQ